MSTALSRTLQASIEAIDRQKKEEWRFWKKVEKTDACWIWRGAVNKNGYGSVWFEGRVQTASRVAFKLHHGADAPAHLLVCHSCDNPLCVCKEHLFLGTNADNRHDCMSKGRAHGAKGERNCKAKLTTDNVVAIRASSLNSGQLGRWYGVNRNTIMSIRKGKTWQ